MSSIWLAGMLAFLPALLVSILASVKGSTTARVAAAQLTSGLLGTVLVASCFAFEQPSTIDLALTLALLTPVSGFLVALFYERWL